MTRPAATPARRCAAVVCAALAGWLAACTAPPSTPYGAAAAVAAGAASAASAVPAPAAAPAPEEVVPPAPREFRAAWVATVAHIDWPSTGGLCAGALRAEALAMLERARSLGLNALVLQVRPAGDAIYPSALEPWTEYLSGTQGRAPVCAGEPAWDPLAFWVHEAHRRGLELHAWFNPYRARHSASKSPLAPQHLALRRPALVKRYGDQLWADPGEAEAAAHLLAVVADVVGRYDVDGVHIDDYFYPYPVAENGVDLPFPDDDSFARYRLAGGTLARDDWRRANVDALVRALHERTHALKPWVKVGISPFGIGRPDRRPAGVSGFSQFDKLYADVEKWLENGWLDYLAPQLYWPRDRVGQPFEPLLDSWLAANPARRHVWPGLFTSQITRGEPPGPRAWPAQELLEQLALVRARPGAGGHLHFSLSALMQDRDGIATRLRQGAYAVPALVPATPWLDDAPPPPPTLRDLANRVTITPGAGEAAARWAVWRRHAGAWRFEVLPGEARELDAAGAERVAVGAVDRAGNLSAWTVLARR